VKRKRETYYKTPLIYLPFFKRLNLGLKGYIIDFRPNIAIIEEQISSIRFDSAQPKK
jgi:hypothetical protein